MSNPKLLFDFQEYHKNGSLLFQNPLAIITTNNLNHVVPCFNRIKKAIDDGYYVAGFVSYEATYAFYKTKQAVESDFPLLWFGVFSEPVQQEKQELNMSYTVSDWNMNETKQTYLNHVEEILQLINKNHTEQVNYTVPFQANFSGDTASFYQRLKKAQKANFNAYFQFDDFDIISVSPEKFFSIKNNMVTVRPMKGTVKRGLSLIEDTKLRDSLSHSEKNKFENDLITHLMTEELKVLAHNLEIYDRYRVEKYPTVWQMTSGIKGYLKDDIHPVDVLTNLFPCGSIAGTPKQETIEIISRLENKPRGIYCGTLGYFTPNKEAVFNVAIRTVTIDKNKDKAQYHAGGAITKQSTANDEYEELLAKTNVLTTIQPSFHLLETMLLSDGIIFLKKRHITRLKNSAQYFDFIFNEDELVNNLKQLEESYIQGMWRVRILLDENGNITSDIYPLEETTIKKVQLANEAIDKNNVFLYHKTTERWMFDKARKALNDNCLDVLLWNQSGEITEFTIGNIVVEKDGQLITPPLSSGLLPGTFREQLLADGVIKEEVIHKEDLNTFSQIWLINSLRKWVKVSLRA